MAGANATRSPRKKTARKKLYGLHTWVGFHLAAVMTLVLFTGTFAVISNEIDWLIQKDMRVVPDGAMASWGEIEAAARNYRPGDTVVSIFSMRSDHFAYRARMLDEYGRNYFLHINQWTGKVTGTSHTLTVQRFFRDLHRYLFMPNVIGLPLVTSLAFVLTISLYTGLRTTRNWRTIATRIRFDKGLRVAVGDGHKATGLWASWFFIVIIATSLWYLAEFAAFFTGSRFEPQQPKLEQQQLQNYGTVIKDANADALVVAAKQAFPELEPRAIFFSLNPNQTVSIKGRNNDFWVRDRANSVFLDPVSAEVIKVQRAEEIGWVAYLNQVADPLHFGYLGGLVTKILWFFLGIAMTGLSVSGVWLTWRRLKTMSPTKAQIATLPVLLATMIFGAFWYDKQQGPYAPKHELYLPKKSWLNIDSQLVLASNAQTELSGLVRLLISSQVGRPNIVSVELTLIGVDKQVSVDASRLGRRSELRAEFTQKELTQAKAISANIILRNGDKLTHTWSVPR